MVGKIRGAPHSRIFIAVFPPAGSEEAQPGATVSIGSVEGIPIRCAGFGKATYGGSYYGPHDHSITTLDPNRRFAFVLGNSSGATRSKSVERVSGQLQGEDPLQASGTLTVRGWLTDNRGHDFHCRSRVLHWHAAERMN